MPTEDRASDPPRRVVVTSPRMTAPRRQPYRVSQEIDSQTRLGEVYMASLIRSQLRLALVTGATLTATIGLLPLVFWLAPTAPGVLGLPLPWLVLGVVSYPALLALAWWYVRQAERNETQFAELVDRS